MSLFGLFSKDIKQNSTTTNTDSSRITNLTDSLNSAVTQNLAMTRADSRVYNSAFDAIDSFNTVNSFEIANIGGGTDRPMLDFTGLRSLFTSPAELSELINANKIDADPNANKYHFDFASQSQGSSDFLKQVGGLVSKTWEGLATATVAAKPTDSSSRTMKYALIAVAVVVGLIVLLKLRK